MSAASKPKFCINGYGNFEHTPARRWWGVGASKLTRDPSPGALRLLPLPWPVHFSNALVYPGRLRPALGTPMAWHYSWHLIFLIFALSFSFLHFPSDAISSIFNGATLKGPFSIGSTKKPISRMCRSQLTRFVCLCIPNSSEFRSFFVVEGCKKPIRLQLSLNLKILIEF